MSATPTTEPLAPCGPLDSFDVPEGVGPLAAFGSVLLACGVVMQHFPYVVYRDPVRLRGGGVDYQTNWAVGASYEAACWYADREFGGWSDRGLTVKHWVDDVRDVAVRGVRG